MHLLASQQTWTKTEWLNLIEEKALKGTQLIMDRKWISFMHSYDVATIPRYILLDKEGKIINLNMPRPSNPQCMKNTQIIKEIRSITNR